MTRYSVVRLLVAVLLWSAPSIFAAIDPICDVECAPNPGQGGYGSLVAGRTKPQNARGASSPTVKTVTAAGRKTTVGSQSYNYVIPILQLPGRNGLDVNLNLIYNSRVWTMDPSTGQITFNLDRDWPSYGFRMGFGYIEWESSTNIITLTEADSTKHRMVPVGSVYVSTDSTYIQYAPPVLTYKDGTQVTYEQFPSTAGNTNRLARPIKVQDTNGNFITIQYVCPTIGGCPDGSKRDQDIYRITDTLNRIVEFQYDASTPPRLTRIVQNPGAGNEHEYATFVWDQMPLTYTFTGLTPNGVPQGGSGVPINVLRECRYANGVKYRFEYGGWGLVNTIEQRSADGVTVRNSVSYNFPAGTTAQSDAPTYSQQSVFDGTSTQIWTHSVTKTAGLVSSYTLTAPDSGFAGSDSTVSVTNLFTASDFRQGLVQSVQTKRKVDNAILRTMSTDWTSDADGSNPRLLRVTTTLNDSGHQSKAEFQYDARGNVTSLSEFDFGFVLKRKTDTIFISAQPYLDKHIFNRVQQIVVRDSANAIKAKTDFGYDGGTLISASSAANHDDTNFGTAFATRGNLTAITRWINAAASTGPITRTFQYDMTGNLRVAQLDCCVQKEFVFDISNQFAYPLQEKRGTAPQFIRSFQYDATGKNFGLLTRLTDENQKQTDFTYDNIKRLTIVKTPDGFEHITQFDDSGVSPKVTQIDPLEGTPTAVTKERRTIAISDGLGRVKLNEVRDKTNALFSAVSTEYDNLGRPRRVSNPHTGTPSQFTTTEYDALSRPKTITQPVGGSTSFSYWGPWTTTSDPAGKQRAQGLDALGRLIQVNDPGGAPGQGSVTISGFEQSYQEDSGQQCTIRPPRCPPPITVYDVGSVSVTINNLTISVGYGKNSTAASIAGALATGINNNGGTGVTASVSGSVINLQARISGASTNYSLSASSQNNDPTNFPSPSFTATRSGPSLTGGSDVNQNQAPNLNTPYVTWYAYDVLDNLTNVWMGAQTRTYAYDSLGRLTSSTTPESGATSFTYHDFGQVSTRTDARGVVSTYFYDGLRRLDHVTYSDGTPAAWFGYDGGGAAANANGRMTITYQNPPFPTFIESYSYDPMGRINQVSRGSFNTTYAYNAAGQVATINYPSGRAVTYEYDNIGRLKKVKNNGADMLTIPDGTGYSAAGQPLVVTYGNGVSGTFNYNDNLQLAGLRYQKPDLSDLLNLAYEYAAPNGGNNGQISKIRFYTAPAVEDLTRTEVFQYDAWSRLANAQTQDTNPAQPNTWALTWSYDRYGNRRTQTLTAGSQSVTQPQLDMSPTTNRITTPGLGYDNAGNLTNDAIHIYAYDAENRIKTVDSTVASYAYDNNGLRMSKFTGGAPTFYVFSGSKVIAEYVNNAPPDQPSKEYIYAGSQLLATIAGSSTTYSYADHLSVRGRADASGNPMGTSGHLPFGEVWYETGTPDKWKFTSYERDSESSLDYAMFRYDSSRLGRFMTADLLAGSIGNPQSLNRYSYVSNDPANLVDPSGLCFTTDAAGFCPLLDWGFDASRGGGGIFGCMLDGFSTPCSLVAGALASGAAVNCPQCGPGDRVGADNLIYRGYGSLIMNCTGPIGGSIDCVPGGYAVRFLAIGSAADSSGVGSDGQWWKDFLSSFVDNVVEGGRKDGETRGQCVLRNANETTFGAHGAVLSALAATAAAAISNAVPTRNPGFGIPGTVNQYLRTVPLTTQIGTFATFLSYVGSFGALSLDSAAGIGVTVERGIFAAGRAAPYVAAAEVGLLIGSAINCR